MRGLYVSVSAPALSPRSITEVSQAENKRKYALTSAATPGGRAGNSLANNAQTQNGMLASPMHAFQ